jgi:peptide/nickel transport system ATP-binding protein
LDLHIARGETLCLLGESGCGKSMTALAITRLLPEGGRILSGHVRLDGDDLLALPEAAMRRVRGGCIGMIFQEPKSALNPVLTIGRQIGEVLWPSTGPTRAGPGCWGSSRVRDSRGQPGNYAACGTDRLWH